MTIQANDFTSNTLTGTVEVQGGTITVPLNTNKLILEGDKTFTVRIRKDNAQGQILDTSPTITLDDQTSVVSFAPNVSTVSEGANVKFSLVTTGVPNNYRIYYDISGNTANVTSGDVTPFNGSALIVNNSANIEVNVVADLSNYVDDNESFAMRLRTDSITGTVVATSNSVVMLDTSNAARIIGITLTRETSLPSGYMYEGEILRANIQTVNGEGNNAATLYYSTSGNALIYGSNTGSFVINDNYADIALTTETTISNDAEALLAIQFRSGSPTGILLNTSDTVTVYSYVSGIYYGVISRVTNVYPDRTAGYGDETFNFTVDIANSYENEPLYYRTTGNITTQSGSFNVSANTATIPITVPDSTVTKVVGLNVYRDNTFTKLLGESNTSIEVTPNVEQFIGVESFDENIVEGEGFAINIITQFGQVGQTPFYYTVSSNGTIQSGLSGSFDSSSNLLVIPETNIPDGETREVQVKLRTNSISGPVIYTSNILIVDSYQGQTPYNPVTTLVSDISANITGYYFDGGSLLYTVNTTGIPNDTLYYTLTGNVSSGEILNDSGTITITGNTGTVLLTGSGTASVDRVHSLQIRRSSTSGTVLGTQDDSVLLSAYTGYIAATGGTIEDAGGYRKHIFTSSDTLQITTTTYDPAKTSVEYLIVGGGAGGRSNGTGGAGGGGGGVKTGSISVIGTKGSFTANIGAGGGSSASGSNTDIRSLSQSLFAFGGGSGTTGGSGGGAPSSTNAQPGFIGLQPSVPGGGNYGNPGGASRVVTPSPTFDRRAGGGGGGAGGAGVPAPSQGGAGGPGIASPLAPDTIGAFDSVQTYNWNPSTNTWNPFPGAQPGGTRFFAAGGGGSSEQNVPGAAPGGRGGGGAGNPSSQYNPPYDTGSGRGQPAIATSGSGGGGGAHAGAPSGSGGSGVIIIRYPYV